MTAATSRHGLRWYLGQTLVALALVVAFPATGLACMYHQCGEYFQCEGASHVVFHNETRNWSFASGCWCRRRDCDVYHSDGSICFSDYEQYCTVDG